MSGSHLRGLRRPFLARFQSVLFLHLPASRSPRFARGSDLGVSDVDALAGPIDHGLDPPEPLLLAKAIGFVNVGIWGSIAGM